MTKLAERSVPCNGCTACCKSGAIILHPDNGDDPNVYKGNVVPTQSPITGMPVLMLDHKPNGDCVYLGMHGCTIWEKRPVICREFDCRLAYLRFSKATRRRMLASGSLDQATVDAGRERLDTLTADERLSATGRPML